MINTFLSEELEYKTDFPEIRKIAEKLAKKAFTRARGKRIHVIYEDDECGERIDKYLDSEQAYCDFLLAKDFYRYELVKPTGFWYGLKDLDWRCKITNICSRNKGAPSIREFRVKYPQKNFEEDYKTLEKYGDINLAAFRKLEHEGSEKNPKVEVDWIFDYRQLESEDRHKILNIMDVPVCPYCNMNYTIQYEKNGEIRNSADIDHFYSKSEYPEYALCIYNMIPACPTCNSRLKLAKKMTVKTHIYPHAESFAGEAEFRIKNLSSYLVQPETGKEKAKEDAEIKLEIVHHEGKEFNDIQQRVENSTEVFCLNERYQSLHTCAEELIDKAETYTEGYSEELEREFGEVFQGKSVREMVFGPSETEKEYGRRSLGKMRMDLLRQLGIFK